MQVTRREFVGLVAAGAAGGRMWGQAMAARVRMPLGELEGVEEAGVRIFRGVPFAAPPVGGLRFRPPAAAKAWTGVRQAKEFAAAAMQPATMRMAEDCLFLNVWAPAEKGPHPVFVWIHGGGLTGGRASDPMFDGSEFAREGVVVVTIGYRLGVFGFLEMEPVLGERYRGSANNGLRDAVMALEWVNRNIASFGGDPSRVTVGGQSAGAKITDLLLACEAAKGLFHQAISQSGGVDRSFDRATSVGVGEAFGEFWKKNATGSVLQANAETLLQQQVEFLKQWPGRKFPLRAQRDGALVPLQPLEGVRTLAKGRRVLVGTNRDESAAFLGAHPKEIAQAELSNMPVTKFQTVYAHYDAVYPQMSEEERRIRAVTAEEYWLPSMRVAEALAAGGAKTYVYRLDYQETRGALAGMSPHGFDLHLMWDKPRTDDGDASMAKRVHAAWVGFIRGQEPRMEGAPAWPAFDVHARKTMVLDRVSRVEEMPQGRELALWDGVE